MYIEIAQRDHKEKCTVCGCELHQKERFLVIFDGKSERKLCLKCARKRVPFYARNGDLIYLECTKCGKIKNKEWQPRE